LTCSLWVDRRDKWQGQQYFKHLYELELARKIGISLRKLFLMSDEMWFMLLTPHRISRFVGTNSLITGVIPIYVSELLDR